MTLCPLCERSGIDRRANHAVCDQIIRCIEEYDGAPLHVPEQPKVDFIAQRQEAIRRLWDSYRFPPRPLT